MSPSTVASDNSVDVTVEAINSGGSYALYNATLKMDNEVVDWKMMIHPGEHVNVTFTLYPESEGSYDLELCGKTGSLNVVSTSPAEFQVSDLSITPASMNLGESVSVFVSNIGGTSDSYHVSFKVNGAEVDSKDVTLDAGKSTTVSFTYSANSASDFLVDVNGLTGSFTVSTGGTTQGSGGFPIMPIGLAAVALVAIGGALFFFMKMKK